MREISVLGVEVEDHSLREALRLSQTYFENGILNTICYLDTDLLMRAKDDEEVKKAVQEMDLNIPGSVEILKAGGVASKSREKEVRDNFFLRELLKRFAREKRRVFLVARTEDDLVELRERLLAIEGRLTFFGSFAYDERPGAEEALINEINSVIPDVIFSNIASPDQELIVSNNRMMVNAKLWIAMKPACIATPAVRPHFFDRMVSYIDRHIFKRVVTRYESEEKDD